MNYEDAKLEQKAILYAEKEVENVIEDVRCNLDDLIREVTPKHIKNAFMIAKREYSSL